MPESERLMTSEYISPREAGKHFGYSGTYLILLAKKGKINGKKIGAKWHLEKNSIATFLSEHTKSLAERKEKLSYERKAELRRHTRKIGKFKITSALTETLLILGVALFIGCIGYAYQNSNDINVFSNAVDTNLNRTSNGVSSLLHGANVAALKNAIEVPQVEVAHAKSVSNPENQSLSVASSSIIKNLSIVVGPLETLSTSTLQAIREEFSDHIEVIRDGEDTGIIVPQFNNRAGREYRFLMVPVTPHTDS